jgi:hypothetical protein
MKSKFISVNTVKEPKPMSLKEILAVAERQIEFMEQQMQEVTEEIEKELYLQRIENMKHVKDEISKMIVQEYLKKL